MTSRTPQQKIGAVGHKWAMLCIENHPHWLARNLDEDFGIDAEAELTERGLTGEILKLQFKTTESVVLKEDHVRLTIDRKYIEYAATCRYPVVFVLIDSASRDAWYLWVQDWLLQQRRSGLHLSREQMSFTVWVPCSQTLVHGLDGQLKDIARWRGQTQLVLSLLDAMRAAAATESRHVTDKLVDLITATAPEVGGASLDIVIEEAVLLGDRLRGTTEGNNVSDKLFDLVRRFGGSLSPDSIDRMVRRQDSYSRTGLIALGILYDDFFSRTSTLGLPQVFLRLEAPHLAYYCALREANPTKQSLDFLCGPGDFRFADLRFDGIDTGRFANKYANRGPSAILDFLVRDDAETDGDTAEP